MTDTLAFKIETAEAWAAAQEAGVYEGSALDRADGFIHLSTAAQTRETAARWFGGRTGLVLVEVDLTGLGEAVVFEASRGGELFPHLYAPLPMHAVAAVWALAIGPDGAHVFPDVIA
jgi:uncharacterized protein (DUF952 family)